MLLAFIIFLFTLVLVIWQPKGLGIGYSAVGGAALALAAGVVPVNLVALLATLLLLWLVFAREIPRTYSLQDLEPLRSAIKDELVFRLTAPLLIVLLLAYFLAAPLGMPVALITGAAALSLMAVAGRWWQTGHGTQPSGLERLGSGRFAVAGPAGRFCRHPGHRHAGGTGGLRHE